MTKDICFTEGGGIGLSKAIFVYAYVPTRPTGPEDGGFSVNLFEENMLAYTRYAVDGSVIREWRFAVPPRVIMQYMATINHARGWLKDMYACIRLGESARYTCRIGIDGFPLFLMEDIQGLMDCPFRSARGHYARMMYNLLEDISTEFYHEGFNLWPEGFAWDANRNTPTQITDGKTPWHAMRQNYRQA